MPDTKRILSEFQKAINFYAKSQVVDLDENFNEKFEFHALRLEKVFGVNKRVPPNRWSFHRIGIITQGSGEFQTGIYRFAARKNTLVMVPARVITSSRDWSDDIEGMIALFNLQFLRKSSPYKFGWNKKILNPYIKPYVYKNDDEANSIITIFETILKEQSENKEHREELIALKAIELIIKCERLFTENNNTDKDSAVHTIVTNFIALLEKHFHEQHSASFYASKLNLHPNYLNALVKKYTNETTKESINNRVLIEIKYLLHSTSLSIKEIANRVGFSDPNYLASFFRRMEKISPVVYRSANSKELILH